MPEVDHYLVLGVPRDATSEEIRQRYRELVRVLHPDVNRSPEGTARFLQVTESYQVLSDPTRRAHFDALLDLEKRKQASPAERTPDQSKSKKTRSQAPGTRSTVKTPPPEAVAQLESARKSFASGQLRTAEHEAKLLVGRYPRFAPAYALLGDIYQTLQKWELSARMYELASRYDPEHPKYRSKHRYVLEKLEKLRAARKSPVVRSLRTRQVALGVWLIAQALAMTFVTLSNEHPLQLLPIIVHWTPGLIAMLFLSGALTGVLLFLSGQLERWGSTGPSAQPILRPTAITTIAAAQFWVALATYGIATLLYGSTSRSISRLFGWSIVQVLGFSLAFAIPQPHGWPEVLIWGGNLVFLGAIAGWRVADATERE